MVTPQHIGSNVVSEPGGAVCHESHIHTTAYESKGKLGTVVVAFYLLNRIKIFSITHCLHLFKTNNC